MTMTIRRRRRSSKVTNAWGNVVEKSPPLAATAESAPLLFTAVSPKNIGLVVVIVVRGPFILVLPERLFFERETSERPQRCRCLCCRDWV
jgi:hypothetical protein